MVIEGKGIFENANNHKKYLICCRDKSSFLTRVVEGSNQLKTIESFTAMPLVQFSIQHFPNNNPSHSQLLTLISQNYSHSRRRLLDDGLFTSKTTSLGLAFRVSHHTAGFMIGACGRIATHFTSGRVTNHTSNPKANEVCYIT